MFDHVAISVSDLAASERFYRTVLSWLSSPAMPTPTWSSGKTGTARTYYGGFLLDPDGHNIEVVNHNRG